MIAKALTTCLYKVRYVGCLNSAEGIKFPFLPVQYSYTCLFKTEFKKLHLNVVGIQNITVYFFICLAKSALLGRI